MKEKYLIVTDLDGTLLSKEGIYKGFSRDYLKSLKEQGHIIVIATGRTLNSVVSVLGELDFVNYVIVTTGAAIYDVATKNFIYVKEINQEDFINACPILMPFAEKFKIRNQQEEKIISLVDYSSEIRQFGEITGFVLMPKENEKIEYLSSLFKSSISNIDFLIMQDSFVENQWFDGIPKGVSKYNAIAWLQDRVNIPDSNIIAFGDGLNDIDMIEKCAIGVAVNNALPQVKKVAKYITDKNQEEGVLLFLKNFFKNDVNSDI